MPRIQSPIISSDRPASLYDVHACYRLFLGRESETADAALSQLADSPSVWTLVSRFHGSAEAQRRRVSEASALIERAQDGRGVNLDLNEDQAQALTAHVEQVWSRYGREDAYFSVLTNPRYRAEHMGGAEVEEFYATGQEEVDHFLAACARNAALPPTGPMIELGCGVGRMGEAFARRNLRYDGVDISAGHLHLARERLAARGVENARLRLLPDYLADDDRHDLFFSVLVLQHNPPPIMHRLLDTCLARLNPGGLAYFQAPCRLFDYGFETGSYLAGAARQEAMEMHALPQSAVFALLARHGLTPIEVTPDDRIGAIGISYTYLARKTA
ncbi:class I SAM-dependent methyltransferase [Caulobacter sp. CCNWLY153]|uniref:SAM-dependent methyltransferase n=1 Tax=unclassified Caulobacter TaxID=2648921 RepID=UPI002FF08147